jgi:hypothetical protein
VSRTAAALNPMQTKRGVVNYCRFISEEPFVDMNIKNQKVK